MAICFPFSFVRLYDEKGSEAVISSLIIVAISRKGAFMRALAFGVGRKWAGGKGIVRIWGKSAIRSIFWWTNYFINYKVMRLIT